MRFRRNALWVALVGLLVWGIGMSLHETVAAVPRLLPAGVSTTVGSPVMVEGEDLLYEVSWLMFKLGTIRLKILKVNHGNDTIRYTAGAYIDSYNIRLADLHSISYTEMDSALFCRNAWSYEKRNNEWWVLKHRYDPAHKRLIIEDTWQKDKDSPPYKPSTFDTLSISGRLHDGLSILYFARAHVHSQNAIRVPTIVYKKLGKTNLYFTNENSTVEIEAMPAPVEVTEFDGLAEFEGLFGLSGEFKGWFSNDDAAVPIKAKLGVILGSVDIELKEWKRAGWTPPLAR
jgi:hypothetical protein